MQHLRRAVLLALIIGLAAAGLWYYRGRSATGQAAPAALPMQVVEAKQGNLRVSLTVVGELDAVQRQDMTFSRMKGSAALAKLNVKTGDGVHAGDALAAIDPAPYQQSLDQARSDLQSAQERLADLTTPASALDLAKAELAVAKAEANVEQTTYDLSQVQAPDLTRLRKAVQDAQDAVTLAELQQAQTEHNALAKNERDLLYAVDWHQRRINELQALVDQGQANLEQTQALAKERETLGATQSDLARVQASRQLALQATAADTAQAKAALADAQDALAKAQAGGDALALAKARLAVQDAQVTLATAKDNRDTLTAGPDAVTLTTAKADVDRKKLAVADAEAALAGATLTAPFDGTILRVNTAAGNLVGANTTVLSLANLNNLNVLASVDETSIRRVQTGQDVQITFDAFAGQTLRGKVLSVPLQGELQGNVMVYEVPISLQGGESLPLLVGMTANAQIQTGQANNAVLIPSIAVQEVGGKSQVLVPNPADAQGPPQVVDVQTGLSDGTNTQIVSGLSAGEKVLVRYTSTQTTNQNRNQGGFGIFSSILGGRLRR